MKIPVLLVSGMIFAAMPACGQAQTPLGGTSPASSTPIPANDNAIIAEIRRVDAPILRAVEDKLYRIRTGTLMPGLRGADPSAKESEEIAANPDFAQAYQRDPVGTLMLLRWINQELHRHRGTGSG